MEARRLDAARRPPQQPKCVLDQQSFHEHDRRVLEGTDAMTRDCGLCEIEGCCAEKQRESQRHELHASMVTRAPEAVKSSSASRTGDGPSGLTDALRSDWDPFDVVGEGVDQVQ
jgi:hypothetical protein